MSKWQFDARTAEVYESHVLKHIPLYETTIAWCIDWAKQTCAPDAAILDFGCATGSTLRRFAEAGFTNLWGVDCSREMWSNYQDDVIHYSTQIKPQQYDLILANWTLHFNQDKWFILYYLRQISNSVIVSEKCTQTPAQQAAYWQWKQQQGVTTEEIVEKAVSLEGIMFLDSPDAYPGTLVHSLHEFYTWKIDGYQN